MKSPLQLFGVVTGTLRAEYRQLANRYFGSIQRFEGNGRTICLQVVDQLWQGDFYRTSLGHFDFYWMRDFGTVCDSLLNLGHRDKVIHTLKWALRQYRKAGRITTCIDKTGNCFEAPGKAIDTLPWLLHCLTVSNYPLSKTDHKFLEIQLQHYQATYLHADGRVRKMKFGEMRDAVIYDRSAYALSLVGRLAHCVQHLRLTSFLFPISLYKDDLLANYWNGDYFNADRSTTAFSAECALFPFYLGIVVDDRKAAATFDYITKQNLNEPFPLVYTNQPEAFTYHWWMTAPFMPQYAGNTVWSWHGEFYLHLLKRYNRPEYAEQYRKFAAMIELHGTFPEMLNRDGSWYYAPVYRGDPGMIWAALFAELKTPQ